MSQGYPDMEVEYVSRKKDVLDSKQHSESYHQGLQDILKCVSRIVDLNQGPKTVAVVGCGPSPQTMADLQEAGYEPIGVEPVEESLIAARNFLNSEDLVLQGTAEQMPFADATQRIVIMENVLEHVDSPAKSLSEIFRVLMPGGVLFIRTTNRTRFSWMGKNWEYNVPFYNWLPACVKES
jgi:2-polyprenyl-6-hydroxyphenyl methylase/3-demethylubiquinone-9 3-methyltransferase